MQADLKRGNAAFRIRGIGLSVAILASATLSLYASDRALAACGASSRPAGVHARSGRRRSRPNQYGCDVKGRRRRERNPRMCRRVQRLSAARLPNR